MRITSFAVPARALAALAVCAAAPAAHAFKFKVIDLGADVYVQDLNNKGQVTGISKASLGLVGVPAYLWDATGQRSELGTLRGGTIDGARSLNDKGEALVTFPVPMANDTYSDYSAIWNVGTHAEVSLADDTMANMLNFAFRNNNAGQLVGTMPEPTTQALSVFVWTPGKGTRFLRPDAQKGVNPQFGWLNNQGNVIGPNQASNGPAPTKAYFWSAKSGYKLIASPSTAQPNLALSALNDSNQATGFISERPGTDGQMRPVIWSASTGVRVLPGANWTYAIATSINNQGNVVGRDFNANGAPFSVTSTFLWSPVGGVQYLDKLIVNATSGTTIKVDDVLKINDLNQILATGTINGVGHAMLLVPAR